MPLYLCIYVGQIQYLHICITKYYFIIITTLITQLRKQPLTASTWHLATL